MKIVKTMGGRLVRAGFMPLKCMIAASIPLVGSSKAFADCMPVVDPVDELHLERFYSDRLGSDVREDIRAANRKQTGPLKKFLNGVARASDRAVLFGDDAAARCAIKALSSWASADALSGPMPTKQGEHHRKWALTGMALSYLKVREFASASDRAVIEPWLQKLADGSVAVFASPNIKRNNHYYWLGLGVAAVGLATGSEKHWHHAVRVLDAGLDDVNSSGFLPLELRRGRKALHYHVFAVTPLVILDWLIAHRGDPVSKTGRQSLRKLVAVTVAGIEDPALFETLTGKRQDYPSGRAGFAGYGWPAIIKQYHQDWDGVSAWPLYENYHRWLGGDIRALIAAIKTR